MAGVGASGVYLIYLLTGRHDCVQGARGVEGLRIGKEG